MNDIETIKILRRVTYTSEVGLHLNDGGGIWPDALPTTSLDYIVGCLKGVECVNGVLGDVLGDVQV
jgi:hypothetical protein